MLLRRRSRSTGLPKHRRPSWVFLIPLLAVLACAYSGNRESAGAELDFERAKRTYEERRFYDAVIELSDFIRDYPGSILVDRAIYYRGMAHFEQKHWVLASGDFDRLVRDFPESRFACDAEFRLAETYWRQARKPTYDQQETLLASGQFKRFLTRCPDHSGVAAAEEKVRLARERMAEKQYRSATLYRKLGHLESALIYVDLVIADYEDTGWALRARRTRIELLEALGRTDEAREERERLREQETGNAVGQRHQPDS